MNNECQFCECEFLYNVSVSIKSCTPLSIVNWVCESSKGQWQLEKIYSQIFKSTGDLPNLIGALNNSIHKSEISVTKNLHPSEFKTLKVDFPKENKV